jgi:hypothetical protein
LGKIPAFVLFSQAVRLGNGDGYGLGMDIQPQKS